LILSRERGLRILSRDKRDRIAEYFDSISKTEGANEFEKNNKSSAMQKRTEGTQNSREAIIAAASLLKALRNDGLDAFILELGLPDPRVGAGANLEDGIRSLRQYALTHPNERSASGEPIGCAIVTRATSIAKKYEGLEAPNVSGEERQAFHDALYTSAEF
jgi:hypothetical protein